MNSCGPAATAGKGKLQLGRSGYLGGDFLVVACIAIRIHTVLISIHREISVRQEREIDFKVARSPIGHGTNVPITAVSPSDYHIIGDACIEHSRFIPLGRNWSEKIHDLGFP